MSLEMSPTLALIIAAAALLGSAGAATAQDAAAGETTFKSTCLPCHDVGEGAKVKLGPPLNGIDGRAAGSSAGFSYSPAMKNSGITWNAQSFKEYMHSPAQKIPGNRMPFAGIKDDAQVDALWAYLKSFDAEGKHK